MNMKQYLATNMKPSRTKFGNIKTVYNGYEYMSKKEAHYAQELDRLKHASKKSEKVVSYEVQVPFQIVLNGYKICKYLLDFKVLYADGHIEHVDVKAFDKKKNKYLTTDIYTLKKKLVFAQYGIEILEK